MLTKTVILKFCFLLLLALVLLWTYHIQIADSNQYMGYVLFPIDVAFLIKLILSVLFLSFFFPARITKPSDFFFLVQVLVVCLPFTVFHQIRYEMGIEYVVWFILLILPMILLKFILWPPIKISIPATHGYNLDLTLAMALGFTAVLLAANSAPDSSGFSLYDSYDRRLEGRDVYQPRSVVAYLNSMTVNGIAPFIAFYAGFLNKRNLLLAAIFIVVAYFYFLGLKAPIFYVLISFGLGMALRTKKLNKVYLLGLVALICLPVVSAIEFYVTSYSYIADYFLRRVFTVPSYVMSAYFELISSPIGSATQWSLLLGVDDAKAITFIVGEDILGFVGANANTNTFVYYLASRGILGYLMAALLVCYVFFFLDKFTTCGKLKAAHIFIGFIFSILIAEQAVLTTLVSSGVGFLLILSLFSNESKFFDSYNKRVSSGCSR